MRAGDTVFHRPTGETWVVAHIDEARNELAWVGWPPGYGRLSDCVLKTECSDEQHVEQLTRLASIDHDRAGGADFRKGYAARALELLRTGSDNVLLR